MTAISHISKRFATSDAKLAVMLTDPAGGAATYGSLIDVPGIKSATIGGTIERKTLRGDNTLLDSDVVLSDITVTFTWAKESLDVNAALIGGVVADSGSAPNRVANWGLLGTDNLFPQFKFEAVTPKVDIPGGDGHLVLYKCQLVAFPQLGTAEDDYNTYSAQVSAVPRISDSKWINDILNETAAAIA